MPQTFREYATWRDVRNTSAKKQLGPDDNSSNKLFFKSSSDYFNSMFYKLSLVLPFLFLNACTYTAPTTGEASSSSGTPPTDVECDTNCSCDLPEGCRLGCGMTGCNPAECTSTYCDGICGFGNACDIQCDDSNCAFGCLNGACKMRCSNNSTCDLGCAPGGCEITCEGGSNCHVNCDAPANPCTVTCSNGSKATCDGTCNMTGCQ